MRRFEIHAGNVEWAVEADTVRLEDGVVQFLDDEQRVVGLARTWDVIVTAGRPGPAVVMTSDEVDKLMERHVAAHKAIVAAPADLPEVPDPFDAFPDDAVMNPRVIVANASDTDQPDNPVVFTGDPDAVMTVGVAGDFTPDDEGPTYRPDEPDIEVTAEVVSITREPSPVAKAEAKARAAAQAAQTVAPDEQRVSNDPVPDQEPDVADANPQAADPDPESTGAHQSPAGKGSPSREIVELRSTLSRLYGVAAGKPVMTEHAEWMATQGMGTSLSKATPEQLEARIADIEGRLG
jgi:hypothetical protein